LRAFAPDVVHIHNVHRTLGFGAYGVAASWPNVATIQDYHLFCLKTENYREEGRACNDRAACASCASVFYPGQSAQMDPRGAQLTTRLSSRMPRMFWNAVPPIRNAFRERYFNSWIDTVICPSNAVRETMMLWGVDAAKIRIVGNAVPLQNLGRVSTPMKTGPIVFGYIGKLTRAKGVHVLIAAFSQLQEAGSDVRLSIAGDGPDAQSLKELAAGVRNVDFLGRIGRDRIDAFYEDVDAVVVPSIWPDVMPLVVLEAMARGKALIVSAIGGMPDQVSDAGLIVPSNDVAALTGALRHVADRENVRELGNRARERFDRVYDPLLIAAQTEDVYREAAREHERKSHPTPA
jgi:glycosyltransferase involved in cell wall biosynthesis